jgi:hypothetical protein
VPPSDELRALFRTLEAELVRTAPGSPQRTTVLASLENVSRAMAECLARQSLSRPSL